MTETTAKTPKLRASLPDFRWAGVERRAYKDEASAPYKGVTRQTLASDPRLAGELRYFEVEPSGYTTLERHEHMHAVMILTGAGSVLVGDEVFAVKPNDLVNIRELDMAPVPRGAGWQARVSLPGRRRTRPTPAADPRRPRRLARRSGDRAISRRRAILRSCVDAHERSPVTLAATPSSARPAPLRDRTGCGRNRGRWPPVWRAR